jgi:uncharacterized membrane protein YphA (DoxX/SURF4 family)
LKVLNPLNRLSHIQRFQSWITFLARLILGGVLIAAGVLKAGNPAHAAMAVRAYELLPVTLANILGYALPWVEMGAGLALVIGVAVRGSAILGGGLMLVFIAAIAQAWARGLSIDCGCFGGGGAVAPGHTAYVQEILRDSGLTALAVYLFRYPHGKFGLDKNKSEQAE